MWTSRRLDESYRDAAEGDPSEACRRLFRQIGSFLEQHRLSYDPVNYGFAYRVLSEPDGPLARAVATLTDGGVRLTRRDIEGLGETIVAGPRESYDSLVARTQMQVEGFEDMMRAIRHETDSFGRELEASARAIDAAPDKDVRGVVRLTSAMVDRVRVAESRLDAATREAAALREQLESARGDARRDPLTDLPNRRALEEAFAEAVARNSPPIALAVCDIDHFKRVNDRFGHPVGDRVLKAIAGVLSEVCAGAVVARYGGEEFTVLFQNLGLDQGVARLEAARAQLAGKRFLLRENDVPIGEVTFSAGLSLIEPGESFAAAFARTDALLYRAKQAGRNRICSA